MTGTFEIVFAGLCFLLLGGMADGGGYDDLQVILPQTSGGGETVCEQIKLYEHHPFLVIPVTSNGPSGVACSASGGDQSCSFKDMGCSLYKLRGNSMEWWCDLNGRELCVEVNGNGPIETAKGRDGRENRPDDDDEELAFDWIPHLARIDGYQIARLKQEVYGPVGSSELIASRIHVPRGELSTLELGVRPGYDKARSWPVKPDRQPGWPWQEDHPKVAAEAMLLRIESVSSVRLESCDEEEAPGYWWKFAARDEPLRIRVQHFAAGEKSEEHESHRWTVGTGPHPHRIRDFLWYYNLVEWMDGQCPDHLSAPICPDGNCTKEWPDYLPKDTDYHPNVPAELDNANHFCQPTTYP